MKLIRERKLDASLCDTKVRIAVLGALQIVEDAITEMMSKQKIDGVTTQEKYGAVWVFTKNRLVFLNEAKWTDDLEIECFMATKSLVKMNAQTIIKKGDIDVAYSTVEMCALDQKAEKIRKVSEVGIDESIQFYGSKYDANFSKNTQIELEKVDSVKVRSTNIDFCHHTNNMEYIRFLLNTYTVEELENSIIKEIEIDYINQSFEGQILDIYKKTVENKDIFEIKCQEKSIVKGEIVFGTNF